MSTSPPSRAPDGVHDPDGVPAAAAPTQVGGGHASTPSARLARGQTVGRYLVVGAAGAGGMGVVYAAYDPTLDRKIALKLLRAEDVTQEARVRLLREAQAMAKLSHPHVVTVYDLGALGDQVFVAMEYVEGRSLGAWLREKKRPWREVLGMFQQAGRGLVAAHAAGILHRDFKPENVMVGTDDQARVLDFGLARTVDGGVDAAGGAAALAETALDSTSGNAFLDGLTRTGAMMGTPAYMAPEQFRGQATDARTDQFSFCVALYEGLYGERPFAGETLLQLAAEVMSGKLREPPRGSDVPGWVRRVLARGLKVAPEERYPSVAALLADLARDPAVRHRRWLIAAGALGVAVASVIGVRQALDQRRVFCQAGPGKMLGVWDGTRRGAVRAALLFTERPFAADAWRGVQRTLDDYAERWKASYTDACEATHRRGEQSAEVLDLRMGCLTQRLDEMRAVTDVLAAADGKVVEKALGVARGLPDLATCSDTTALRAAVPPPGDPATSAKVGAIRSGLARVKALGNAGRHSDGAAAAADLVQQARAVGYAPVLAEALSRLGQMRYRSGEAEPARAALAEAVQTAEASRHDEAAAQAAIELVWVVGEGLARREESHALADHASALVARFSGHADLETRLYDSLGAVAKMEGRYVEARGFAERALAIRERTLGPDHLDVANSLNNLGNAFRAEGRHAEARARLERALAIYEKALGPDHPDVAMALNNLADATSDQGLRGEARQHLERALAIYEKALGPHHPYVAISLNNLADVAMDEGQPTEARVLFERALAVFEKSLGKDHPYTAHALTGLGRAHLAAGNLADAAAPLERALRMREATAGDPVDLAETRFALARSLIEARGGRPRALDLARKAHIAYAAAGAPRADEAAQVSAWLAKVGSGSSSASLGSPRSE